MTFLPSSGKSFILGRVDEAVSNELGLGELAGLTVANEADSLAYDVSKTNEAESTENHLSSQTVSEPNCTLQASSSKKTNEK